jgi:hypothetical protein
LSSDFGERFLDFAWNDKNDLVYDARSFQRPTLNTQRSTLSSDSWALDVGCWALDVFLFQESEGCLVALAVFKTVVATQVAR